MNELVSQIDTPLDADTLDKEKARVRDIYETRAREGEQVEIANCPHCGVELAIFIRDAPAITPAAPEPTAED